MEQPPGGFKAVFDKALEFDAPSDRAAYLDRACAGAPAMRRILEVMLAAHTDAAASSRAPRAPGEATAFLASSPPNENGRPGEEQPEPALEPMLDEDRKRPYQTADSLAHEVASVLNDKPVEASPPSRSYRIKRFVREHRTGLLIAALFVALLAFGVAVTIWFAVRSTVAAREDAGHPERHAAANRHPSVGARASYVCAKQPLPRILLWGR